MILILTGEDYKIYQNNEKWESPDIFAVKKRYTLIYNDVIRHFSWHSNPLTETIEQSNDKHKSAIHILETELKKIKWDGKK